jgi:hypothetical protein
MGSYGGGIDYGGSGLYGGEPLSPGLLPPTEEVVVKTQYASTEALRLSFPPFFDVAHGVYVVGGVDTPTVVVKKPNGTLLSPAPTLVYDIDTNFWVVDIDVGDYMQGDWLVKATSDAADTFPQYRALTWGDYVSDLVTLRKVKTGRWKIDTVAKVLRFYDDNGTTVLYEYDLKGKTGLPTTVSIFERDPVVVLANTNSAFFDLSGGDYASIVGASCPNLAVTEGTFEGWAKINPAASDAQWALFAKRTTSKTSYYMYLNSSGGLINKIHFVYSFNGFGVYAFDWPVSLAKNTWHHYAAVRDATNGMVRCYLDGLPLGNSAVYAGDIYDGTDTEFFIGKYPWTPFHYMRGWIDEVRVWSTVRSDAQILANYNKQLVGDEAGLQGYYQFNDDWSDSSPNGYDLTPGGGVEAPVFTTDVPFP